MWKYIIFWTLLSVSESGDLTTTYQCEEFAERWQSEEFYYDKKYEEETFFEVDSVEIDSIYIPN